MTVVIWSSDGSEVFYKWAIINWRRWIRDERWAYLAYSRIKDIGDEGRGIFRRERKI